MVIYKYKIDGKLYTIYNECGLKIALPHGHDSSVIKNPNMELFSIYEIKGGLLGN